MNIELFLETLYLGDHVTNRNNAITRIAPSRINASDYLAFGKFHHGIHIMTDIQKELKFVATPEKGEVSALLVRPENATHLLVLGHGASTNMRHATLQTIADRMAEVGIATFRYNFPYSEHGTYRNSAPVCTETIRSAAAAARENAPDLPLLAGGHSFGGQNDLDRRVGIADRGCARACIFLVSASPAGPAGYKTRGTPEVGHRADAFPERYARHSGRVGPSAAGGRGPSPGNLSHSRNRRPRLSHTQTHTDERGRCFCRDGPGVKIMGV